VLHTPRLILPVFSRQLMLQAATSPGVISQMLEPHLHGVVVASDWPNPSFAEALPFIAGLVTTEPGLEEWNRLIIERSTNTLIGEIGFKYLPTNPQHPGKTEIGYGLASSARGRGYATEALIAMCRWGFQNGASRIDADCLWENAKSAAVLARAGFSEWRGDQTLRYWMLTAGQFRALHGL
jgi:ribosomal-protein-alanine N-acetyltransferase